MQATQQRIWRMVTAQVAIVIVIIIIIYNEGNRLDASKVFSSFTILCLYEQLIPKWCQINEVSLYIGQEINMANFQLCTVR